MTAPDVFEAGGRQCNEGMEGIVAQTQKLYFLNQQADHDIFQVTFFPTILAVPSSYSEMTATAAVKKT